MARRTKARFPQGELLVDTDPMADPDMPGAAA